MQHSTSHSNIYVSNTALEAVMREINEISGGDDYEMEDFWEGRYSEEQLEALRELGDWIGDQVFEEEEVQQ